MLPHFDVLQPDTIKEACALLQQHAPSGVSVLAGGTDLLVDIRIPIIPEHLPRCKGCDPATGMPQKFKTAPAVMVALSRIPELKTITATGSGDIVIGSMATISDIAASDLVQQRLPALHDGCRNLGSPLVRNRGTLGGNICNARPAADGLVPCYALGARLELVSSTGTRTVPVDEFVTGPGKTTCASGEVLTRIIFPQPSPRTGGCCIKVANRKSLEISVVNVASVISLDEAGKITVARISMGAVGPTPVFAAKAAQSLIGQPPSPDLFARAGDIAATECKPISDHRGSKPYRIDMVNVLVKRTLNKAFDRFQ